MKTALDPRHQKRQSLVKRLYTFSFSPDQTHSSITPITKKLKKLDSVIAKSAPEWPVEQINKIDLAILRLAIYELLFQTKIPQKVTIDEAVELAKTFGSEASPGFVNGVLGHIIKKP